MDFVDFVVGGGADLEFEFVVVLAVDVPPDSPGGDGGDLVAAVGLVAAVAAVDVVAFAGGQEVQARLGRGRGR